MKLTCPNCNKPSFSAWRKQLIGPGRTMLCEHCGARVSLSKLHAVPALMMGFAYPVLAILALAEAGFPGLGIVTVLSLGSMGLYQHYLVPLVVCD
ncbi:MAG: hypothetical protein QNJ00_02635 [Woeseiaceae bacterium]|nr:hypothetical protein [Woeseiaceae bacterium]